MDQSTGGGGGRIVNIASILGLFCAQQPKGSYIGKVFMYKMVPQATSTMSAKVQWSL